MKTSNILLLTVLFVIIFGMFYTNTTLRGEFLKIDLEDQFKNYISYEIAPYSVINIKGSNGYPIEIKKGKLDDVKVLRSRQNHFKKKLVKDTLFIEFTGANISIQQAFTNETPPGIIIENNTLSKIIISNTYNRISHFSDQELDILLKKSAVVDIAECNLKRLNLYAERKSQYLFSKNNNIDSLNLIMLDKSIGHLNDLDFLSLHQSLGDSVTLVLSKKVFDRIQD